MLRDSNSTAVKRVFWDGKILPWETKRYVHPGRFGALGSVSARLSYAAKILEPYCKGKSVFELGCGSGRLAECLLRAGAKHYIGCDLSEAAIQAAKRRLAATGLTSKAELFAGDVLSLPKVNADLVVSLGFIDWLDPEELTSVFSDLRGQSHFHSFSELRPHSWEQWAHRVYVYLSYGRKNGRYMPRYYSAEWIANLFSGNGHRPLSFVRNRSLKFGVLVHNLGTA